MANFVAGEAHPLGESVDRRPSSFRQTLDSQQQNVGIEIDSELFGVLFSGAMETSDLVPELGEFAVFIQR
jgi:hypothetical protein